MATSDSTHLSNRSNAVAAGAHDTVKICVVTPTYNAAEYLQECIDSIEQQRGPGVEIEHLVLDGGSTDGTLDILKDARVTHVPRDPTDDIVKAMCRGYEAADCDLIGYLGADDIYVPGAFEEVAKVWRQEQRPLVFCRARWTDRDLRSRGELAPPPRWLTASVHASLGWNYLGAANTFVSPQLYQEMGGFRTEFTKAEDYEFYTRALAQKIPFSRVNKTVCVYRRHGGNSSLEHDERYFRDVHAVQDQFGPHSAIVRAVYRNLLKSWIYARHPQWAFHQLSSKLAQRNLRGTS